MLPLAPALDHISSHQITSKRSVKFTDLWSRGPDGTFGSLGVVSSSPRASKKKGWRVTRILRDYRSVPSCISFPEAFVQAGRKEQSLGTSPWTKLRDERSGTHVPVHPDVDSHAVARAFGSFRSH